MISETSLKNIGFGGGCHWCTEAVFQSLKGVELVKQGWIASIEPYSSFSEGVIVHFNPEEIDLYTLISIHLYTHSCTSKHSMRNKYRSAIYSYSEGQNERVQMAVRTLQKEFDKPIITSVLPFESFKLNQETYLDYFQKNPDKAFCRTYIHPKLSFLAKRFSKSVIEKD